MKRRRSLRLGWVGYVNTLPLRPALDSVEDLEIVEGVPTAINAMMDSGEIDLASISSIEYARNTHRYSVLPGLSICADGPVHSVLVASRVPLPGDPCSPPRAGAIRRVAIHRTEASATSVVLLDALVHRAWSDRLVLEPAPRVEGADGRLLIGDEALVEKAVPTWPHHLDLGWAWREHTGFPMVFALFCVRREVLFDSRRIPLAALHASLVAAARTPHRQFAVIESQRRLGLPTPVLTEYFDALHYGLGPRELEGVRLFFSLAHEAGHLGSVPDPTDDSREGCGSVSFS